jgi:large conductance mechanosensitive channel
MQCTIITLADSANATRPCKIATGNTLARDTMNTITAINTLTSPWVPSHGGNETMLEEFKKFALKGNVVDLAVGVIIGAAFGAIVTSLVNDIIMPIIGAITGGLDFSNYYTAMSSKVQPGLSYADAKKQGAVLGWGQFLTISLNFIIVAWVLFMAIKAMIKLQKSEPAPDPKPAEIPADIKLLTEIRDLLKK